MEHLEIGDVFHNKLNTRYVFEVQDVDFKSAAGVLEEDAILVKNQEGTRFVMRRCEAEDGNHYAMGRPTLEKGARVSIRDYTGTVAEVSGSYAWVFWDGGSSRGVIIDKDLLTVID